jgi:hypothetical protein
MQVTVVIFDFYGPRLVVVVVLVCDMNDRRYDVRPDLPHNANQQFRTPVTM